MRYLYLILFILLSYFLVYNFKDARIDYVTKENNNIVQAKIVDVQHVCVHKNNRITVDIESKLFSLLIATDECTNQKYKVNEMVEVYYSPTLDNAIMTKRNVGFAYGLSIAMFVFPLYLLILLIKLVKKI